MNEPWHDALWSLREVLFPKLLRLRAIKLPELEHGVFRLQDRRRAVVRPVRFPKGGLCGAQYVHQRGQRALDLRQFLKFHSTPPSDC